jgi:hypothetical protein
MEVSSILDMFQYVAYYKFYESQYTEIIIDGIAKRILEIYLICSISEYSDLQKINSVNYSDPKRMIAISIDCIAYVKAFNILTANIDDFLRSIFSKYERIYSISSIELNALTSSLNLKAINDLILATISTKKLMTIQVPKERTAIFYVSQLELLNIIKLSLSSNFEFKYNIWKILGTLQKSISQVLAITLAVVFTTLIMFITLVVGMM